MKSVCVIDNYDSFTFNLVELLRSIGVGSIEVRANDKCCIDELRSYSKILLSPGPGVPSEAGLMPQVVRGLSSEKSILGVCLGHQCIAEVFGAQLRNLSRPFHAESSLISVVDSEELLFSGLPTHLRVGRYHSWVVDTNGFPQELAVTARDVDGTIMGLRHRRFDVRGIQFHPESILSEYGREMMCNWVHSGERS